jgi:Type IIA topoisomerase (DNA gyrase/topo II, topoisomerase IV), A subunit
MYPIYTVPQGNFGTIDGEDAAAMRYTESALTPFAIDAFFRDYHPSMIEFKPTFDNERGEPEYLLASYPVVLFKGSFGMGYGLYTGIPPYNTNDIFDTVNKLIEDPNAKINIYPDFPMPCEIVNTNFKEIHEKGEGNFRVRGILKENEDGNLEIHSIPYQTRLNKIIDSIIDLVKDKKLIGISDIEDHSTKMVEDGIDKTDILVILKIKKGASIEKIKEILYRSTPLEQTFAVNFELVYDYENIHYNLRSLLLDWISFARETKTKKMIYKYKIIDKEHHTKQMIVDILSEPGSDKKILNIMRSNKNRKAQIAALIKEYEKYGMTDIQANVIVDWKLGSYGQETLERYKKEAKKLEKSLKEITKIVHDSDKIDEFIKADMIEGKQRYGKKRVSKIIEPQEVNFVEDVNYQIVITKHGYVKKLPLNDSEDGIGLLEQGDKVLHLMNINNRESLLIFDKKGICYNLPVDDIQNTPYSGLGVELNNYINTENKIISVMKMPSEKDSDCQFVFVTKTGMIKKSSVSNYLGAKKGGLIAIALKKSKKEEASDSVIDVLQIGRKNKDILIYTENGKAIRFNTKEIPLTLRMSSGVIGIKLNEKDTVTGMVSIDKSKEYLAIITNHGNGKKYLIKDFDKSDRAKEGSNLIRMKDNEKIIGIKAVDANEDIDIFFNNKIETINTTDLSELTLLADGKKVIAVKRNEHIITIG